MKKLKSIQFMILSVILLTSVIFGVDTYAAEQTTTSKPAQAVITSAIAGKTSATITWDKVEGAAGYQLYSCKKGGKFKKIKTLTALSYVKKGLKAKKTYSFKVRAYTKVNGKTVYGKFSKVSDVKVGYVVNPKWEQLLKKYQTDDAVDNLIFVEHTTGAKAIVYLYQKINGSWKKKLYCSGWVGKKGIDKVKEGDKRTPTGTFNVTSAFGIKDKPETTLPYVKVNKYLYWCGDKYYNQLVDVRKKPHTCHGEHLINYSGYYDYGLFIDFNKSNTKGKGSAIFFHCKKSHAYTAGCIAVEKENMLKILSAINLNTKVCIYNAYK